MTQLTQSNPLSSLAKGIPAQTARGASLGGRLFGAGFLLLVAANESYEPTRVFTVVTALLVVATLFPGPVRISDAIATFGAGLLFFSGCVLTHVEYGLALLAMGAIGAIAGFALADRSGRGTLFPAVAFVAAVFVTGALQAAIVFTFE